MMPPGSKVFCLFKSGVPLSPIALDVLFAAARQMVESRMDHLKVVNDDCQGFVETSWGEANLGCITGVIFRADISTMKGNTLVTYLVRVGDLSELDKEGMELHWIQSNPMPPDMHLWN